jgi:hypothetical protein
VIAAGSVTASPDGIDTAAGLGCRFMASFHGMAHVGDDSSGTARIRAPDRNRHDP